MTPLGKTYKGIARAAAAGLFWATLLALAACGQPSEKKDRPAQRQDIVYAYGWQDADTAGSAGVEFREAPDVLGFNIQCFAANKTLRVTVPNPADGTPQTGERAALQLGATAFDGLATPGGSANAKLIVTEFSVTPQLLLALGDSKTARLTFRDMAMEAGVDAEGRLAGFARRCAALTGVEPSL